MLTAESCSMLPCHRSFVCCDIDGECINEVTSSPVLGFAKQALNPDSDVEVLDEVLLAWYLYIAAEGRKGVRQSGKVWKAPPGITLTQTIPHHMLHFLYSYHRDYSL